MDLAKLVQILYDGTLFSYVNALTVCIPLPFLAQAYQMSMSAAGGN